jgi:hypothetical protein
MTVDRLLVLIQRMGNIEPGRGLGEPALLVSRIDSRNRVKEPGPRLPDRLGGARTGLLRERSVRVTAGPNAPLLMRVVRRPMVLSPKRPSRIPLVVRAPKARPAPDGGREFREAVLSGRPVGLAPPLRDRYTPSRAMKAHRKERILTDLAPKRDATVPGILDGGTK